LIFRHFSAIGQYNYINNYIGGRLMKKRQLPKNLQKEMVKFFQQITAQKIIQSDKEQQQIPPSTQGGGAKNS